MAFVWIHMLWFSIWIGSGLERYPFGLLTMIVSLEAIFLSTFVIISQCSAARAATHRCPSLIEQHHPAIRERAGMSLDGTVSWSS